MVERFFFTRCQVSCPPKKTIDFTVAATESQNLQNPHLMIVFRDSVTQTVSSKRLSL
jgi:hypothetical protein